MGKSKNKSQGLLNDNQKIVEIEEDNDKIKRIIKLQSTEGDEFILDHFVVDMCKTVKYIVSGKQGFRNGLGGWFNIEGNNVIHKKEGRLLATIILEDDNEIILNFQEIRSNILSTVLDYCKFHSTLPNSQQIQEYENNLITTKQNHLCELASASYYLDVKNLVCLTSKEIASQISQKSTDEIRETFSNIQLSGYTQFFPTFKMKPYISKKKELQTIQSPIIQPVLDDNRTVDELLQFLGENKKSNKKSKSVNKKNKKTKNNNKQTQLNSNSNNSNIDSNNTSNTMIEQKNIKKEEKETIEIINNFTDIKISLSSDGSDNNNSFNSSFDGDGDGDDDNDYEIYDEEFLNIEEDDDNNLDDENITPDLQDEIDKEVEDFKTRLDLFSRQSKPKLTLPPRTLAALLDVC